MTKIKEYFHHSIENNKFSLGDGQSNRYKCHNDVMSRIMHYEALPVIEHALGKKMIPTYILIYHVILKVAIYLLIQTDQIVNILYHL